MRRKICNTSRNTMTSFDLRGDDFVEVEHITLTRRSLEEAHQSQARTNNRVNRAILILAIAATVLWITVLNITCN